MLSTMRANGTLPRFSFHRAARLKTVSTRPALFEGMSMHTFRTSFVMIGSRGMGSLAFGRVHWSLGLAFRPTCAVHSLYGTFFPPHTRHHVRKFFFSSTVLSINEEKTQWQFSRSCSLESSFFGIRAGCPARLLGSRRGPHGFVVRMCSAFETHRLYS